MHSLSKRSNLAGYRCAFVAGDPALVGELLAVRKNLGLMMPGPQQVAMAAALDDDEHVAEQHARYAARRAVLRAALERRGLPDRPLRGVALPLGARRGRGCWDTVAWLAERGILVAPGDFYGAAGARHVRVAFTATDERVAAAARLARPERQASDRDERCVVAVGRQVVPVVEQDDAVAQAAPALARCGRRPRGRGSSRRRVRPDKPGVWLHIVRFPPQGT